MAYLVVDSEQEAFLSLAKKAVDLVSKMEEMRSSIVFDGEVMTLESLLEGSSGSDTAEGDDASLNEMALMMSASQSVEGLHIDSDMSDDGSQEGSHEAIAVGDMAQPEPLDETLDSVADPVVDLVEVMLSLKDAFQRSGRETQRILANLIFSLPGAIEAFYALAFNLFEFTQGLSSEDVLMQLYLLVFSNIECWVDVGHSLCEKLIQGGMLLQNINDLKYLERMPVNKSEVLQSAVETHLSIISNCARNHPLPNFYCKYTSWAKILSAWASSSNEGLRITCKLLGSILSPFLPEENLHLLDMSDEDLSPLLAAVGCSTRSTDSTAEAFGYRYTTLELLTALQSLACQASNFHKIANESFLIHLTSIIQMGKLEEKVASLKMLWSLLENPRLKVSLEKSHKATLKLIQKGLLVSTADKDIILWSEGILASVQDFDLEAMEGREISSSLATLRCCYAAGKYAECERLYDKMPHSPEANLLKGKALYQLYQKMQGQLRMCQGDLQPKEFFIKHKACYDTAKKALEIFIHAKDNRSIEMDVSCNKMLDFSMMDYLLETNKLKEINRCFLCLKRPQDEKKLSQVEQMETTNAEEERQTATKQKQVPRKAIRASHIIPHGVIKRLKKNTPESTAAAAGTKDVLFGVSGTKLENVMKRTAGTSTLYMLCPSCEHNLNVLGEQFFLGFLEKVYDPELSDADAERAYGKEMYHFCVGLIFRTLCPSQDDYINCDEVYQLLLQCRAFLTAAGESGPLQDSAVAKIPEVFMFVCPVEDESYSSTFRAFITENSASYTSKISLDCHFEELGTFVSVLANFFVVKVGVIVIVVKFSPAAKQVIDERFHIKWEGGSYSIPAGKARHELIPTGVWTVLHLLFQSYEDDLKKANTSK